MNSDNRKYCSPHGASFFPFVACLALCLMGAFLVGCGEKQKRNFFASDGIEIGEPVAMDGGAWRIPLALRTEIVHSALEPRSVKASVSGSDILITAKYGLVRDSGDYPGFIEVKDVAPGAYQLKYRDPDGTLHLIGPVQLP